MAPALSLSVLGQDDVLASSTEGVWRVTAQTSATLLKSFMPLDEPCVVPKVSLAGIRHLHGAARLRSASCRTWAFRRFDGGWVLVRGLMAHFRPAAQLARLSSCAGRTIDKMVST